MCGVVVKVEQREEWIYCEYQFIVFRKKIT